MWVSALGCHARTAQGGAAQRYRAGWCPASDAAQHTPADGPAASRPRRTPGCSTGTARSRRSGRRCLQVTRRTPAGTSQRQTPAARLDLAPRGGKGGAGSQRPHGGQSSRSSAGSRCSAAPTASGAVLEPAATRRESPRRRKRRVRRWRSGPCPADPPRRERGQRAPSWEAAAVAGAVRVGNRCRRGARRYPSHPRRRGHGAAEANCPAVICAGSR